MNSSGDVGFEGRTAEAWVRFQAQLADRLVELRGDDIVVVDVEVAHAAGAGATPYVQFVGDDAGAMLRGEVSSNNYLLPGHALDAEQERALARLGWQAPTTGPDDLGAGEGNFHVDLPSTEADRLAVMATRTLRDVLGVVHPAFLSAHGLGAEQQTPTEPAVELDEPMAVMPDGADHLRELVDRALTPLFGQVPVHDRDGDIAVPWGSSIVYVRVEEERPVVELFGYVALDVTDLERAAFEVGVLNRDERFVKFVLEDDRVMARIHLPAWPFVPEHLRTMLTLMSARLDAVDEDLVARVGGLRAVDLVGDDEDSDGDEDGDEGEPYDDRRVAVQDDDLAEEDAADDGEEAGADLGADRSELDEALLTLLQLDADAVGSVDPELAASVCGHDRALVLRMLGDTERQEIAWRDARDRAAIAGRPLESEACAHELAAWERTTTLLRASLRVIVERARGGVDERSDGGDPDERSSAGRGHRRAARKRIPVRPPRSCVVEDGHDLARFHRVGDLDELSERLDAASACAVEVVDLGDQVLVVADEAVGRLEYPFTLADFQAMVQSLEESTLEGPVSQREEG